MTMILLILLASCCLQVNKAEDPCISHLKFPKSHLGSRNEKCTAPSAPVCDYYLPEGWYSIDNSSLLFHCPSSGDCGVGYPGWMNGTLPSEGEEVANRTVCIKYPSDCCKETTDILVKRCNESYVYYLKPLDSCPSGYCLESNKPCVSPPTTTKHPASVQVDPCKSHSIFPRSNFGSRNEMCQSPSSPVCDYYLHEGWYAVDDGVMLSHCPRGDCGVGYQAWLNGTFPKVSEGIVEQNVCIKYPSNCCKETVRVRMKNCSKFYVYYLASLNGCPFGYCFESSQPCVTTTTTTISPENDNKATRIEKVGTRNLLIAIAATTGVVLSL